MSYEKDVTGFLKWLKSTRGQAAPASEPPAATAEVHAAATGAQNGPAEPGGPGGAGTVA